MPREDPPNGFRRALDPFHGASDASSGRAHLVDQAKNEFD